jgi:hypothetical protein
MFSTLAKSGLVEFRLVQPRRIAPGLHGAGLSNRTYSNDNLPGFRRPAVVGRRRAPTPVLACHWLDRDGRLECHWQVETDDDAPIAPTAMDSERRPDSPSFSAKAIGRARTGFRSGYAALLARSARRNLQKLVLTMGA